MHRFIIAVVLLVTALNSSYGNSKMMNFDSGDLAGWKTVQGNWIQTDGHLQVDASNEQATLLFGERKFKNCSIEVDVAFDEIIKEDGWLSIAFRAKSDGSLVSHYFVKPKTTAVNSCAFIVRKNDQWSARSLAAAKKDFVKGESRHLKLIVQGETVTAHLDGIKLFTSHFCVDASAGFIGLGAYGCKARFDHFSVTNLPDAEFFQALENPDYLIVAHRGYSAKYPENTISAIQGGIDAGSNGIEFDVYQCASGEIVLLHDTTLDRTTDGTGKINEVTLAYIRKLDAGSWKGEPFIGEPVPTLDEALDVFKGSDVTAVVEVKSLNDSGIQQLVDSIASHNVKACVISFNSDVIRLIKEANPAIRCAFLVGGVPEGNDSATWLIEQTKKLKCEVLDINYQILSPELIKVLQENGIEVWAWTVNDTVLIQTLVDWGIDGVTTDVPEARSLIK